MAIAQLKSPVGVPGKDGNGKLVKNKPQDVVVVRRMCIANGAKVPEDGTFDAKLGAVIKSLQKKAGNKSPDGVIVPGDKLHKSLATKYMLAEKMASNVKMIEFKIGPTTLTISPEDYKKTTPKIFKQLERPTRQLINRVDHTMDRYQFYLDTAMLKNDIAMALVQASIMAIGRVDFPSDRKMIRALDARNALEQALNAKDLKKYCDAMRTAERDINAFVDEFRVYVQKMEGRGKDIQGVLEVVSSTAFTAVEILAVPVVMTYTRLPPDKAYLVSKTAVAGIESMATDLGKHVSGQKVSVSGSLGRAGYAMAKELVLGWCGGKIKFKGPLLTRMMGKLGPVLTKAFPFIPRGMAANFAARYIQGFGENALKGIMEALVKGVESWISKGKPPSSSEIEKLFDEVVTKAVLGGLENNLGRFNKDWASKNQLMLRHKMIPMALKKIDSKHVVNETHRKLLIEKIMGKIEGKSLNAGYEFVFADASGHETASALSAKAQAGVLKNKALTTEVNAMILKEIKVLEKK